MANIFSQGWDALTGQTHLGANDFNYDPSNKSLSEFERLKDPRFALPFFQKLAANAQPSRNTLLQTQKAMGGSAGTANAVANAQGAQAGEQALNQYEKATVDLQGVAQGYLGQHLDKEAFIKSGMAQQEYANAANTSGFLDSLIGGGVSAGLNYFTGGASSVFSGANSGNGGGINPNQIPFQRPGNSPYWKNQNTPYSGNF